MKSLEKPLYPQFTRWDLKIGKRYVKQKIKNGPKGSSKGRYLCIDVLQSVHEWSKKLRISRNRLNSLRLGSLSSSQESRIVWDLEQKMGSHTPVEALPKFNPIRTRFLTQLQKLCPNFV